ncbi:MAG: SDR family oxidoreductase [Ectothiorhodospiraceae bacterium]|nr:SDR family oxidoreductase [Ectothiorhodospiraceae bacterium]
MRVVLISGASSGIGKTCAAYLHGKGHRVYGTSRHATDPEEAVGQRTGDRPEAYPVLRMDVRSDQSVQQALETIVEREGRIDVVVNNAGYGLAGPVEETPASEARDQLDTNFMGVARVCRAAIPLMRAQGGGHIVNMSSMAGVLGVPFQGFYSASKFAVEGMTQALRQEVRPFGIRVALIRPGDFRSGFTAHRRKVQPGDESPYRRQFDTALDITEKDELRGPSPERIAHLLEQIMNDPSPRFCYTTGSASQRFLIGTRRVIPFSLFERLVQAYYRLR